MALARWQATIQDEAGDIQPAASVEVRRDVTGGPIAVIYSDRDGLVPLGNPFLSDAEGFAAFHAVGGPYRITVTKGAFTQTLRYVAVGLGAETDGRGAGVEFMFSPDTTDSDPGEGFLKFDNAALASVTKMFVDDANINGVDMTSWLDSWDAAGSAANRGSVMVQSVDGSAFVLATVTGSVVNDGGYRDVSLTVLASGGAFSDDQSVYMTFTTNGADGEVTGPASATENNFPRFADTTGKALEDSGKNENTVGAGRQTQWIPSGAMRPRTTSGAATGSFGVGLPVLDFDQTTQEYAVFSWPIPKKWDRDTVTFAPYWTAAAGSAAQTCEFELSGAAISNDDPLAAPSFGTAQSSADALIATSDLHIGPESSAITISGTPADADMIVFQITRDVANDNLAADARLLGIRLFFTTNANTDT